MKFIIDVTEQMKVKPDTVNVIISIIGHEDSTIEATERGTSTLSSVKSVFKKFDDLQKVKINRLNVRKVWKRVEKKVNDSVEYFSEPNGFEYSSTVIYTSLIYDSSIEKIINELNELQLTDISMNISFSISDLDSITDDLLKKIIVKANHKAEIVSLVKTGSKCYDLDTMNTSSMSNTVYSSKRASMNSYLGSDIGYNSFESNFSNVFDLDNLEEQVVSLSGTFEYTI